MEKHLILHIAINTLCLGLWYHSSKSNLFSKIIKSGWPPDPECWKVPWVLKVLGKILQGCFFSNEAEMTINEVYKGFVLNDAFLLNTIFLSFIIKLIVTKEC